MNKTAVELILLTLVCCFVLPTFCKITAEVGVEEDWGDGLKVLTTYKPKDCKHVARNGDIIHYHYVGRLVDGTEFGKSFDYNSPYIVKLGARRIIAGMDRGLEGTCLWERRRITFPSELGYGHRGAGKLIPPDATLVFYIRMVKIERGDSTLEDKGMDELWYSGLQHYTAKNWQAAVNDMEQALTLFDEYQTKTAGCLEECHSAEPKLTSKERQSIEDFSNDDPSVSQFLLYTARANCLRRCKKRNLPYKLRNPDPLTLENFQKRVPYSYLHFSYYNMGNIDEGARCAFTYYFYNPNDTMITGSIKYYRNHLKLGKEDFISREAGQFPHHDAYLAGKDSYNKERWLESADKIEEALTLYTNALNECRLNCDDILYVNLTKGTAFTEEKLEEFKAHNVFIDSMDYRQLLKELVAKHLQCKTHCRDWVATVNGEYFDKYLPGHFNYLQYDYFKLGLLNQAAVAASTFKIMEPSDVMMSNNIKYFRSTLNIPLESFQPRTDFVEMHQLMETEGRILQFVNYGNIQKKQGQLGDEGLLRSHTEL